ncbi:MAG: GFA family protein [Rhodobacteraceae bacterium]|nr:GFA family protein [Paracoccaceae bacterium]
MKGQCLCGAVELCVDRHAGGVSVCHCSMCRRWSGSAMPGLSAAATGVSVTGPVQTYRSSSFAERAWCGQCGSHLWIRDDDAEYDLMPGLFEGARDLPLVREVYVDRAWACARYDGDHPRLSRAEYQANHHFVEDVQ